MNAIILPISERLSFGFPCSFELARRLWDGICSPLLVTYSSASVLSFPCTVRVYIMIMGEKLKDRFLKNLHLMKYSTSLALTVVYNAYLSKYLSA
jgi:hypothetical protein